MDRTGYFVNTSEMRSPPKFSFGGRPATRERTRSPGPAAYLPEVSSLSTVARAATPGFGSGPRSDPVPADSKHKPGPGKYEAVSSVGAQALSTKRSLPSFSLRGRQSGLEQEIKHRAHTPGPGAYSPTMEYTRPASPAYSLRSRREWTPKPVDVMGPGSIADSSVGSQVLSNRPSSPSFSMRGRSPTVSHDTNPGPGAYEVPSAIGGASPVLPSLPSYSLHAKPKALSFLRKTDSPGPGAYEPPEVIGSSLFVVPSTPAFSLGGRISPLKTDPTPSPSAYEPLSGIGPQKIATKRSMPAFSFGTDNPRDRWPASPSPGPKYGVPSAFGSRTLFNNRGGPVFAGRVAFGSIEAERVEASPGPKYLPPVDSVIAAPPRAVFGKSGRAPVVSKARAESPGPGAYEINFSPIKSASPAFTMRPRTSYDPPSAKLDPTSAATPSSLGRQQLSVKPSSPSFSLRGRWKEPKPPTTPGPGAYGSIVL